MISGELCGEVWACYLKAATGDPTGHFGCSDAFIIVSKQKVGYVLFKHCIKSPSTGTGNSPLLGRL